MWLVVLWEAVHQGAVQMPASENQERARSDIYACIHDDEQQPYHVPPGLVRLAARSRSFITYCLAQPITSAMCCSMLALKASGAACSQPWISFSKAESSIHLNDPPPEQYAQCRAGQYQLRFKAGGEEWRHLTHNMRGNSASPQEERRRKRSQMTAKSQDCYIE